ncbi:MAG: hypothetical protein QNJ72_44850 [Pleurocapsa sp. MO_226.B13]|nr:hypothetical protein [Pleurocapsa sp. MO_226.B13]
MVVNNQGKIVSLNRKFISIWKLPQDLVKKRCQWQVFQFIAEQLNNPQSFLIDIKNVHGQIGLKIKDQVLLRDGRSLLYLTECQYLEEKIVGRIWKFWETISN